MYRVAVLSGCVALSSASVGAVACLLSEAGDWVEVALSITNLTLDLG